MTWFNHLGDIQLAFIILFIIGYGMYAFKMYWASRKFKISFTRIFLKFIIRSIYFFLIIIALLGPSFGNVQKEKEVESKDIYFALDLSASMHATDIIPSRLTKALKITEKIQKGIKNSRMGLIIFSREAYIHCPLTSDKDALNLFTSSVHENLVKEKGTDLNAPLQLILETYQNETGNKGGKIVILISDGEDQENNTSVYIPELKKAGIHVYSIGIGTNEGAYIWSEKSGQVKTKLNSRSLETLASGTGGKYFSVSSASFDPTTLIREINNQEGTTKKIKNHNPSGNKYFYFLFFALIFIFADVLITFNTIKI